MYAVDVDDCERWLAGHDWSASTLRSAVNALRSLYGWAASRGHVTVDPTLDLRRPPEPRPCPKPTPPDVLDHALAHSSGQLHLLVRLAACTGLRRAEPPIRRPAAAEPSSLLGYVAVSSVPARARVYVGDVYHGLTPMTVELPAGVSQLHIKLDGWRSVSEKVAVRRGATVELELQLQR